ncbi:MAG: enoyl-CoA hydratase/isomerase family protein [Saprospiraceae bacterium]|nr:enoyl-CoA hydratase/isomerase family protein [Saprospiraceae bacterium]
MSTIFLEIKENVAYIKLNRPEVYNSFNREMSLDLQKVLDQCGSDSSIRALWISGEGKAFSAGQDLKEATDPDGPTIQTILNTHYNPLIERIRSVPKPVIAAVNGIAAGAGANLALACDVVVASNEASFIQAFGKIGLIPDCSGTFMLPRLIGWGRAAALMMTGEKVMAEEALRMGMIYKVYTADQFEAESKLLAQSLAAMPTKALAFTKFALNESFHSSLHVQLANELKYQIMSGETLDFKEGINAFLEKRKPVFKGQ